MARQRGSGWSVLSATNDWTIDDAMSVVPDARGGVWIGTHYDGLVLWRDGAGEVRACNRRGDWRLPADAAELLGAGHPFLEEAAVDLAALCGQADAGDFVISGWDPELPPLSFPQENGAHGGPGSE